MLPRLDRRIAARPDLLELPEKAVQFGTGALLRGFVEYFIDEANQRELFGGRVVAVGSTGSGRDRTLSEQDGLYTLAIRGIENGRTHTEYRQISALSRALSAATQWQQVLECAHNPALELIFSNTTETGIRIDDADLPGPAVPKSFPAKLTRFLYERATHFGYARERGVVVLPCELIEANGATLKSLVLELAARWSLGADFTSWIEQAVPFCNTLVDRIVPGAPDGAERERMWRELGYRDELLTVCEPYRLFAIEADAAAAQRLPFTAADPHIIVADDITPYRARKLRLLNGTHTIMVPAALLAGCETVAQAVSDEQLGAFVQRVLFGELVRSTDVPEAASFARQVLDRFSNPYIRHALLDITLHQTMKMRVRIVPAIIDYAARTGEPPALISLGFAAYLLYIVGGRAGARADDGAEAVRSIWRTADPETSGHVARVCAAAEVWGTDLTKVPGFASRVAANIEQIERAGMRAVLEQQLAAAQHA